jgi:putative peptidoglycan lipid II flippase
MALLRAITTVGGYTLASRVLGFIRDVLIAAVLGAGAVADAFFISQKIPNLFRHLFAEGAFNAAFVPQFAGLAETDGERAARTFAEQAMAVLIAVLLPIVITAEIAMPLLMYLFAPGFIDEPERFGLAVVMTRITFPYLLFISLVSLMGGVLNSMGRFAAAAATPMLLNLCMIATVLWLSPYTPTPGHALAWGVALSGVVQFAWLLIECGRAGLVLRLRWPKLTPAVKLMLKRVVPGAIGAGVYQVNVYIDMVIASLLPLGSISYLYYADRVTQLPLGVVGVAAGTALLPFMTRRLRANDSEGALAQQNRALEFSLLLTFPAAIALIVIAQPIVDVLFQRGAFDAASARATADALAVYAVGLPAYVLVKGLTPGFFAREDTVTPVKIAGVALLINVGVALALIWPFQHLGIAAATAASAWFNTAALGIVLARRGQFRLDERLRRRGPRIVLASGVMALVLWAALKYVGPWMAGDVTRGILGLIVLIGLGGAAYGLAALLAGAVDRADLRRLRPRRAS